jgi:hypothetical protein
MDVDSVSHVKVGHVVAELGGLDDAHQITGHDKKGFVDEWKLEQVAKRKSLSRSGKER